jgi:hypothetical protein
MGLWAMVGVGGLGGVAGLVGFAVTSPAAAPAPVDSVPSVPSEVAGFAQLAIGAWLGAGPLDETELDSLYLVDPEVSVDEPRQRAHSTAVVEARQVSAGYWAVIVAANVDDLQPDGDWAPAGLWFLEVGVIEDSAGGLIVAAEPGFVAPPQGPARSPKLLSPSLRPPGPDDSAVVDTVNGYLAALLTGQGDAARYVAPEAATGVPTSPPFRAVTVDRLAITEIDNSTLRVRLSAIATSASDIRRSLSYELTLKARDGRWEVAGISGAPTLTQPETSTSDAPDVTPTPSSIAAPAPGA